MRRRIVVVLVALPLVARAEWFQRPSAAEVACEGVFVGLVFLDARQTRWWLQQSPGNLEWNPILGRRPSALRLNALAAAVTVAHAGVAYALPRPWRNIWQYTFLAVEAVTVQENISLSGGLRLAW